MLHKKGFTLLELIIVIAILGILASLLSGQFLSSLKKGRDARRKADLHQVTRALELYYEDNKAYPTTLSFGGELNNGAGKVYMYQLPSDPTSTAGYQYLYSSDGSSYTLYSCLENSQDQGQGVASPFATGYSGTSCGTACGTCKFKITSSNTN